MLKKVNQNKFDKIFNYRSIWISDFHLGTRGCQSELLLEFIKYTQSEKLYLVGDIIDGWALKNTWYWPQSHNDVVQTILRKARTGTTDHEMISEDEKKQLLSELENVAFDVQDKMDEIEARTGREVTDG